MKLHTTIVLACALAAGLAAAYASERVAQARQPAAAGEEPVPRPALESLEWMAGSWQGTGLGGSVEEHWSRPAGGSLIGMFRLSQADSTSFAQFMVIEAQPDGRVVLRFKHFNPGYEAWEKDAPLAFDLTQARPGLAVFESPDPKQTPLRMTYSARGEKAMSAVIESPEGLGGPISFELLYKRPEALQ